MTCGPSMAAMIFILPPRSDRHWDQGLRKPSGSVYRLLEIIFKKPEIAEELKGA